MGPTCSLLTVLTTVVTGMMSIPAAYITSIAFCFTSKRFVMCRWLLPSLVTPSNWKYARSNPASFACSGELRLEREAQPVRRRLHREVAHVLRVAARLEEVRRHRRLAAGELHRHLPARLERDRRVEDLLDLVERELVDVAHLVGVHEARAAHHVAAVRQVDREHGAAAVLDGRRAVPVHQLVAQRLEVAARVALLDQARELRIDREQVLEVAVLRHVLRILSLPFSSTIVRLDLAHVAVDEVGQVALAVDDGRARLDHAARAERVGVARPAQRGLGALVRLEERAGRPLRLR